MDQLAINCNVGFVRNQLNILAPKRAEEIQNIPKPTEQQPQSLLVEHFTSKLSMMLISIKACGSGSYITTRADI